MLLGIDTGGTYCDAVLYDQAAGVQASAKALTTKHDLSLCIGEVMERVLAARTPEDVQLVSLSTTLATNAVVEGQGNPVCLILIGYDEASLQRASLAAAIGRDPLAFISGGHGPLGDEQAPLDEDAARTAVAQHAGGVEAFAVAGYFGVRNPAHELRVRDLVRETTGLPVLTDVHLPEQCAPTAEAVDVLQIPAFLSRQTDLVVAAAETGCALNIKKGQFLSPWEMQNVVDKARSTGNEDIMVCERGFMFGYNNLVSDMRSLAVMRGTGCPVVFDATHSVQQPGGLGSASGGRREFIPVLARAATAVGIAGLFMETHPDPDKALSDGPNAVPLAKIGALLETLVSIDRSVKQQDYLEAEFGLGN